ncbi:Transcriptional regulator [Kibdelosporangium sp. 4NS15]|uniref:Transcriptional regulator n=3 Tax=Kibdelosporangium persicum TaxID=2698649 RepID=A0ABX2EYD7_9PSEU|nr:Transcriptional regulator [Kibdelosporangium persicum]
MEDSGGVSVSDLVKRHSRTDLPIPQVNGAAGHPAAAQTQTRAPRRAIRDGEPVPPPPPQGPPPPAASPRPPQASRAAAPRRQAQPRPEQPAQQMPRPEARNRAAAQPTGQQPTGQRPAPTPPRDATGQRPIPQTGQNPPNPAPRPVAQASGTYQVPAAQVAAAKVPPAPRGHTSGPRPMPQNSAALPAPAKQANGHTGQHPRPPRPPQPAQQLPVPNGRPPKPVGQMSAQLPIPPAPLAPPAVEPEELEHHGNPQIPAALKRPAPPSERKPLPPRRDIDAISMTTEMEAISEDVKEIRRVDATLARFSAVHDELAEEERLKKEKRERLMPWLKGESEGDEEPDVLAETQAAGNLDQELADLPTVSEQPAVEPTVHTEPPEPPEPVRKTAGGGGTRKPPRSRLVRTGRIAAASIAAVLLVGTGAVWGGKEWIDGQFQEIEALDQNSSDIKDSAAQFGDENFLMVGSDTREGAEAEDGVGTAAQVKGARSDTIMIAHIPKDRKRVVMVSFPRDLEVQIPACEKYDSATGDYGEPTKPLKNEKINAAFMVGGPKCVTRVIQNLTGLKINHFVGIDFHGFKDMVDAVQGVEVCASRPMYDTELKTWIVEKPGQNVTLTGDAALNFVRARHVRDSPTSKEGDKTSDYGRIKRQQRFLSSLLRKAMSGQVLLDPTKLSNFVGAFSKATFGEGIDTDQLITLGRSLQSVGAGKVTFITVPTVGLPNDRGNEVLRDKDNKALFNAIINKLPLPGEQPDGAPQAQAGQTPPESLQNQQGQIVDPQSVKIQVLNAGAADGEARRAATSLRNQGFQVLQAVDAGIKIPNTVVRYGTDINAATTLSAAVVGSKLEKDDSLGGAVVVMLGQDYSKKIQAPSQGTPGSQTTPAPPPAAEVPKNLSTVNAGDDSCA